MFNVLNANFAWHSSAPACLVILLVTFEVSNNWFGFGIKVLYSYGKNWLLRQVIFNLGLGLSNKSQLVDILIDLFHVSGHLDQFPVQNKEFWWNGLTTSH